MTRAFRSLMLAALAAASTACPAPGGSDAAFSGPPAGAGAVVDSTMPRDRALREFRNGLEPVDALTGRVSGDSLLQAFVEAVAANDTAELGALVLDRREFAHIFYPTTPQGLPPYDLSPQLMWDLLVRQSERGLTDVLRRLGGRELGLVTHDCGREPAPEGDNNVWGPCTVTLTIEGHDTLTARLTGPILEHAGRYKFISYTNDLD